MGSIFALLEAEKRVGPKGSRAGGGSQRSGSPLIADAPLRCHEPPLGAQPVRKRFSSPKT
jgi:hypothetical protein